MSEQINGWDDNYRRSDGMAVQLQLDGKWLVMPPDDRPTIKHCPCCGSRLGSPRAAIVVAEAVYPLQLH